MLCQGVNGRGAPQGDPRPRGWALVTALVTLTGMEHVTAAETQGPKAILLILHSTLNDETHQEKIHTPSLVLPCCVPVVSDKLRVKCC